MQEIRKKWGLKYEYIGLCPFSGSMLLECMIPKLPSHSQIYVFPYLSILFLDLHLVIFPLTFFGHLLLHNLILIQDYSSPCTEIYFKPEYLKISLQVLQNENLIDIYPAFSHEAFHWYENILPIELHTHTNTKTWTL